MPPWSGQPPARDRSPWLHQALASETPDAASPPLKEGIGADCCIVGGGFSGLWTAIELRRRDPTIDLVLLEADLCGAGASGANAGYLMNLWPKAESLIAVTGRDELLRWPLPPRQPSRRSRACLEHGVDAQIRTDPWIWGASNDAQLGAWDSTLDSIGGSDHPLELLDAGQAAGLTARTSTAAE